MTLRSSSLARAYSVDDVRALARRRLPKGLFEFLDRGSENDVAVRQNLSSFDQIKLQPRVLIDVAQRSTAAELFGQKQSMPLAIAPTGAAGLLWFKGELELARAAKAAGVPFTIATRSLTSIEDIADQVGGTLWLQLYPSEDIELSFGLLDRATRAGFQALVVTVDTPAPPLRTYNDRNGFATVALRPAPRAFGDMARHPSWLLGVVGRYALHGGSPRFENLPGRPSILAGAPGYRMLAGRATWEVIEKLRQRWPGKFVLKGILRADDAIRAVAIGADAIIVSNHGGRNFDSTPAPIDIIPDIVAAVAKRADVFLDSGIRRGSDIAKALASGAAGVLVGRATLYGVAVAGREGAEHVLKILQRELDYTLAVTGVNRPSELSEEFLVRGHQSPHEISPLKWPKAASV